MIVNIQEADIIRYIYQSYIDGMKVRDIFNEVKKKNINGKWSLSKVYRILKEEQYTGVMIYGKRINVDVASRKRRCLDKTKWKRVEAHHPIIIDKKLYEEVRHKMKREVGH